MRTFVLLLALCGFIRPQTAPVVAHPVDTGAPLVNPGMGWVLHHYDNNLTKYGLELEPSDTVDDFPGVSVVYLRLAWSYLEPEEGRFNWSIVDTPAQRWIAKGKKVAFRFSASESDAGQPYATPEWVRKAGAKGRFFKPGQGVVEGPGNWEPDFDDPVFLAKLDGFLAAAAARYDGSPDVAFIDMGSFGVWGEGHTFWSTKIPYTTATVKRHMDLHRKHFKRTLVAAIDDFASHGRGRSSIGYARDGGFALRDDSILVQPGDKAYFNASMAADFWPRVPVILESEHYGHSKSKGYWQDGSKYLDAVEAYHASYATVHWYPREFYRENRALVDRINLRLGYRLQLVEASWPSELQAGGEFRLGYRMQNGGVAPCLPGGHPAITLKDAKGGIAAVFVDEAFNVRELPPAPPGRPEPEAREVRLLTPPAHILRPGVYDVYFSVGSPTGTPGIALPLAADDGQKRYRLGRITVR